MVKNMVNEKKERCVLTSVIETELEILKRHVDVLKTLQKNQPMGIIKLSELTNYPQHMVRYSLRILEQDGLVEPSSQGAVTTGDVPKTMNKLKKTLKNISETAEDLIKKL
jgi:predicted transcriptional regulator